MPLKESSNVNGWRVSAVSVRGASHVRRNVPNQDAFFYWLEEGNQESAILAVSDGHGSLPHFRSEIGAQLAVETATSLLRQATGIEREAIGQGRFENHSMDGLQRRLVESWLREVNRHFEQNPFTAEERKAVEDEQASGTWKRVNQNPSLAYGATLLVVIAAREFLGYLQLGDGDILTVDENGHTSRPLPADERLTANQTTSLCQPEAWKEFRTCFVPCQDSPPALVLVSTDGYANSFRSDEDFLLIGRDYLEMARQEDLESISRELPEILQEASAQGSGDDITLGLLLRPALARKESHPIVFLQAAEKDPEAMPAEFTTLPIQGRNSNRNASRLFWLGIAVVLLFTLLVGYLWWITGKIPGIGHDSLPEPAPRPSVNEGVRSR